jgi:hypothetical protein
VQKQINGPCLTSRFLHLEESLSFVAESLALSDTLSLHHKPGSTLQVDIKGKSRNLRNESKLSQVSTEGKQLDISSNHLETHRTGLQGLNLQAKNIM